MGEGLYPVLQRAPSSPHSGAGSGQRAAGWCWEDGGVSERDELLERLREAVFLPQPRDGSLCRYSTVSFILCCHGRTAFHLSEFSSISKLVLSQPPI